MVAESEGNACICESKRDARSIMSCSGRCVRDASVTKAYLHATLSVCEGCRAKMAGLSDAVP